MRMLLVGISAALIVGCNDTTPSSNIGNVGAVPTFPGMPAPSSSGNGAAPNTPGGLGAPAPAGGSRTSTLSPEQRAEQFAECAGDLAQEAPGTDPSALCSCAVEFMAAGDSAGDSINRCATQLGVPAPMSR